MSELNHISRLEAGRSAPNQCFVLRPGVDYQATPPVRKPRQPIYGVLSGAPHEPHEVGQGDQGVCEHIAEEPQLVNGSTKHRRSELDLAASKEFPQRAHKGSGSLVPWLPFEETLTGSISSKSRSQ